MRLVVLEATGGYELPVMAALAEEGIAFARVNPARVRAFALVVAMTTSVVPWVGLQPDGFVA